MHPCSDCFLINYVHPAHRDKELPCHFIPLSREGETIYSLLRIGDVEKLEQLLLEWLEQPFSGNRSRWERPNPRTPPSGLLERQNIYARGALSPRSPG